MEFKIQERTIQLDKTKSTDWTYEKDLPKCNIEYEQGKYQGVSYEAIQIINILLKTELKDIIHYIYDMGYESGYENGRTDEGEKYYEW